MPLILLNKPFHVLSQFRDREGRATLGDFIKTPGVYPAGRLDYNSEGLLLLTDDGRLQSRISEPREKLVKIYRVQVEGVPGSAAIEALLSGVELKDGLARALSARTTSNPTALWPRDPPVRFRAAIPSSWIEIAINEGRNRLLRRMTAAAGLPTLRLIRYRIGPWTLGNLQPGESRAIRSEDAWRELRSWNQALS